MSSTHCRNVDLAWALAWLSVVALPARAAETAAPRAVEELRGRVVGVADGDTVRVRVNEKSVNVRLQGIDAPELGQSYGSQSKEALAKLVTGKTVTVRKLGQDQFDRTLGVVLLDGVDVNARLVAEGWAWRFRYASDRRLAELEAQARAARRGLWSDSAPLPPWEYRARQSGAAEEPKKYWLNTTTGVRHNQGCPNFGKTKQGRVCGPQEGRPCGMCGG